MWKHDNNLLWCLKPRKQLWHFQIGSFIWVCWLGLKHSTLSRISPWTMFLECAVPPLSISELPPAPARDSSILMAMVSKAQEAVLGLQHENPVMNPAGPESLGLVQFSKLSYDWTEELQNKVWFISSPFPSPHSQTLQGWHFSTYNFYSLFLKSPHCTFVLQLRQLGARAQSRGEGARQDTWASLHAPSLALLAGTDRGMLMPCHLPPYLEGRCEWSCAGAPSHFQQRAAGWAQLSVRVWHCLTNFQAVTVWHNDMYDHMENHNF